MYNRIQDRIKFVENNNFVEMDLLVLSSADLCGPVVQFCRGFCCHAHFICQYAAAPRFIHSVGS